MFERRSLRLPITLGVVMFVLLAALLIGWVLLSVWGLRWEPKRAGLYIALLSIGATLLTLAIVGTALYLTLSIKAINLSRRQSNFIDSVTHELKSPIAALKLYLQTLNRRALSPAEQEIFFRDMLEDIERLDQLINHLLDVARLEKDRVGPKAEDVRLDAVIADCADEACERYRVPPESIQLELAPMIVRAAPVDLQLIVRNLLDNGLKYADPDDPRVEVELCAGAPGTAVVRVADNGRGIPHSLRQLVFGRFVRLGSELERDKPGTGLGLYIVRSMVSRIGGKITVRDREQSSGAMFEVSLPGTAAPAGAVAVSGRRADSPGAPSAAGTS